MRGRGASRHGTGALHGDQVAKLDIGEAPHLARRILASELGRRGDRDCDRPQPSTGAVDGADGFEGFELLRPTDDRRQWLVVTRWRDEESFAAWLNSPAFGQGHRSQAEREGGHAPPPVGVSSELWSYEPAGGSAAQPG